MKQLFNRAFIPYVICSAQEDKIKQTSTEAHRSILPFDETLLNVTDIAMGLHLFCIFLNTIKGKCLVVAIGILLVCDIAMGLYLFCIFLNTVKGKCLVVAISLLLVCHHIATKKSRKLDYISFLYIFLNTCSNTFVKFLFRIFIL